MPRAYISYKDDMYVRKPYLDVAQLLQKAKMWHKQLGWRFKV
ncbi:MAG: hypothetical protein AAGA86_10905 [Bacteroidota bacterium]